MCTSKILEFPAVLLISVSGLDHRPVPDVPAALRTTRDNRVNTTSTLYVITCWTDVDVLVFISTCISRYMVVLSNDSVAAVMRVGYSNGINDNRLH